MIKKLLSILLALAFLSGMIACSCHKPAEPTPAPSAAPSTTPSSSQGETDAPVSAGPIVKSDEDEKFEKLSNDIFFSIATSDGFTYHQFIKDPKVFGIDENEVELGWGSISLEAHENDHRENDELLEKLHAIDRSRLIPMNAIAYDTIIETLELANGTRDYYWYSEPLETLNGNHTMLPLMMTMYEIASKSDLDGYMYLLEDMPRYIGEIESFEVGKAEKGLFMTENALDTVLESLDRFIESGEKCFLIDFLNETLEKGVDGVSAEESAAYSSRGRECVLNAIIPAYSSLKAKLSSLRSKCGAFVGASERGDDAKSYFVASIKNSAACDMEPDAMADLLNETAVTLISKLMQALMSDPNSIVDFEKDITSGDLDKDIEYLLELIKPIYPSIPEQTIDYISVPDAVAEDFSPAAYLISAYDDPSRNIVITNPTADKRTLLFTMAHECFPGHLYQTQFVRNGGFPLAQQIAAPSGYSEGWAVFSELMIASRAERYGVNACLVDQYNDIACNIIIPAYISLRVNYNAWDKAKIKNYLAPYGLNNDEYVDIIYQYAINMPDYFFNYGMGFACTYSIYHEVNPMNDNALKSFFNEYLSLGPCCYDVLFKHFGVRN